ncbi:MAG: ABC transporter permease [Lysobacteraceae bacterium]|nr:MAG: ABC transporter permease [Xanthomonadaceae bacterium]
MPRALVFNAYLQETRSEILRYLRNPGFVVPMLAFSTVFYVMFGIVLNHGNPEAKRYLLASYSVFGVMGPGLFGFGVSLGVERENGLLTLKRALPMPPMAYLLGKMAMALLMAAIVMVVLLSLGLIVARVPLTVAQVVAMMATGVLGVLPFCALGLLIGTLAKGQGAPGMVNLVYLPMAFLSGLWLPLSMLPKALGAIAPMWPSAHLNALMQTAAGIRSGGVSSHVFALAGFTLAFLLLAARRLRRNG